MNTNYRLYSTTANIQWAVWIHLLLGVFYSKAHCFFFIIRWQMYFIWIEFISYLINSYLILLTVEGNWARGEDDILMCIICNEPIKPIQFDKLDKKLTGPGMCFMFLRPTAIMQSEEEFFLQINPTLHHPKWWPLHVLLYHWAVSLGVTFHAFGVKEQILCFTKTWSNTSLRGTPSWCFSTWILSCTNSVVY